MALGWRVTPSLAAFTERDGAGLNLTHEVRDGEENQVNQHDAAQLAEEDHAARDGLRIQQENVLILDFDIEIYFVI
jgi:hypothetical protein